MANNFARYTMVSAKNKWEEQGFHLDDSLPNYGLEQFVYNRLHELVQTCATTSQGKLQLGDGILHQQRSWRGLLNSPRQTRDYSDPIASPIEFPFLPRPRISADVRFSADVFSAHF
ncbi:hypothetical protein V6N13_024749 [Hibiscus sabdariffa]